MENTRALLAIVVALLLVLVTTTVFASTSATSSTSITAGSSLASGDVASLTIFSNPELTRFRGAHWNVEHILLAQINIGSPEWSDSIVVSAFLEDTESSFKYLGGKKSWLELELWYPDPHSESEIEVNGETVTVSQDPGSAAKDRMTTQNGNINLVTSMPDLNTYYILASIRSPGGQSKQEGSWHDFGDVQMYFLVNKR